MAGLRVMHGRKNCAVLDIPTKDRGVLKFFTSISGMKEFAEGKRSFIFFNPRSDFGSEGFEIGGN